MLLNGRSDGAADKIVIEAMDGPVTGGSSPTATAAATVRAVASLMPRNLIERDASLAAGDRLAQAVLHQLGQHADANLTRYAWTRHLTVPVSVFAEKADAEVELDRLKGR